METQIKRERRKPEAVGKQPGMPDSQKQMQVHGTPQAIDTYN